MSAVLADLTWPDAERAAADAVLAVPMGSTEQHGPHLPLSTDTDIAVAIAGLLAQARPTVVVAPALPFGSSGEHEEFAGDSVDRPGGRGARRGRALPLGVGNVPADPAHQRARRQRGAA